MANDVDMEIDILHRDAQTYHIVLRYQEKESNVDPQIKNSIACINIDQLREHELDIETYGKMLSQSLFAGEEIRTEFNKAISLAEHNAAALRIRLFIDQQDLDLHNIIWEALRDPRNGYERPLLTNPTVYFSRYLRSSEWRPVRLHQRNGLRALVMVANPSNITSYYTESENPGSSRPLAAINSREEIDRARTAMNGIEIQVLAREAEDSPICATLENLTKELSECGGHGYDILYIVCHGAIRTRPTPGPCLYFENDKGECAVLQARRLVDHLADLPAEQRPRLIVFASCQSGGSEGNRFSQSSDAMIPIGPLLAKAGIPAVLSMQGDISMRTVEKFMPVFFSELCQTGLVDQAAARARTAVVDQADSWMPVLFMRLRDGCIWRPHVIQQFEKWNTLIRNIKEGLCLPILGPGMVEKMIGSRNQISADLARAHSFPLLDHDRESLPQVTQFLTINQDARYPYQAYRDYGKEKLPEKFPIVFKDSKKRSDIMEIITAVGQQVRQEDPNEAHHLLAKLHLPIYITTNPDNLMANALQEEEIEDENGNKVRVEPQEVVCNWKKPFKRYSFSEPTPAEPLVFYLFGRFDDLDSLVLTQDDYFDFMISIARDPSRIPGVVSTSLVESVLLFLGFPIDDWGLRLIFRYLRSVPGFSRLGLHTNISVQIDPEDGRITDPERARKYFKEYFGRSSVDIYWGRLEEFVQKLDQQMEQQR